MMLEKHFSICQRAILSTVISTRILPPLGRPMCAQYCELPEIFRICFFDLPPFLSRREHGCLLPLDGILVRVEDLQHRH